MDTPSLYLLGVRPSSLVRLEEDTLEDLGKAMDAYLTSDELQYTQDL